MSIYLDSAATTKADPEVIKTMRETLEAGLGNASQVHKPGVEAAKVIEKARNIIAGKINASPEEIFFTSGGTESNNMVIQGLVPDNGYEGKNIVTSPIEHHSVLEPLKALHEKGCAILFAPVDSGGRVDAEITKDLISEETILVSIMHANNEIGTIEPIAEIGAICRERRVPFHTDACQSFTKVNIDVEAQNLDLLTLNGHKMHGPHGVGALYVRKGIKITPILLGGGHEGGLRPGTSNTEAIAGFGRAVEVTDEADIKRMTELRDFFIKDLYDKIEGVKLNGDKERLCNNINVSFEGVDDEIIFKKLNEKGIYIATGSACSSGDKELSYVILATGASKETAAGAVRISLSKWTTREELEETSSALKEIVSEERAG